MSARKLPKKVLMANLMAIAAAEAAHEDDHRARFDKLIARIRSALDSALNSVDDSSAIEHLDRQTVSDFHEARRIAKEHLRMRNEGFEAAVAVLNTPISRVVNTCPSGKDTRDLPDWLLATPEFLRLSYDLKTPEGELGFIVECGARWGYTATQIAKAKQDLKAIRKSKAPFRAKLAAEKAAAEEAERAARNGAFDARMHAGYLRQLAYEATNPPVPDYVIREREWREKQLRPNNFVGVEVVFEEDEFTPVTPEEMVRIREAEVYYLQAHAKAMIRELEKLTEQKFERRWKTKAELHAALRAHFKAAGYDEELDMRWLRFGEYTAA
jgi:hypothetical protein